MTEMTEATVLNRKRSAMKGQITRIEHFLQNKNESGLLDSDSVELNSKLDSVIKLRTNLEEMCGKYYAILTDSDLPPIEQDLTEMDIRLENAEVILLTSDDDPIGKAIAREVGIISKDTETVGELSQRLNIPMDSIEPGLVNAIVLSGSKLRNMTPEKLDEIIDKYSEIVFTEIDPAQKLDIVASCQRLGWGVAVTGTTVADCAALKKADIGISLATNSCDMSNDAADIILLDSDFSSIVSGIQKGRLVFDNIQKTICYNLTCNLPEFLPFLLLVVLGIPLPLGVTFIVLIDLGFEMLPTLSLTHEKGERDIMKRNPRAAKRGQMVNPRLLRTSYLQIGIPITVAGLYTYFVVMAENGFMPEDLMGIALQWNCHSVNDLKDSFNQEWTYYSRKTLEYTCQTAFFITIVIAGWFNAMMCKARQDSLRRRGMRNHFMNFSFFIQAIVVLILLYTPGMSLVLHIFPIKSSWLLLGLPFNFFILAYDELRRDIVRHSEQDSWMKREIY